MSYLWGAYISDRGLKNIRDHKYQPGEWSEVDKVMDHFWTAFVKVLPLWMAPNLVTLLGLLTLVCSYACMLYYDMSMTQRLPEWTYIIVAFGIFSFQTLDAVDGKQARRTGSSSPLGQLFDHGCDALSFSICSMTLVSSLQLGLSFKAVLTIFACAGRFFCTNLLEHYSGVYVYSIGPLNNTFGTLMVILFNLLPGIFGNHFYDSKVTHYFWFIPESALEGLVMRDLSLIFVTYLGIFYTSIIISKLFLAVRGFYQCLEVTLQLGQHLLLYVLMLLFTDQVPAIKQWAGVAYLSVLLIYTICTSKLILCTISEMKYDSFHFEFLLLLPYFFVQSKFDESECDEVFVTYAFWATFVTIALVYARFVQCCINQLTEFLDLPMFSIKPSKTCKL